MGIADVTYTPEMVLEALRRANGETGFERCADAFGQEAGDVAYAAWGRSAKRGGERGERCALFADVGVHASDLAAMADALNRLAAAKARGPLPAIVAGQRWDLAGDEERPNGRYVVVGPGEAGEADAWVMRRETDGEQVWMRPWGLRVGDWMPASV